MNPAPDARGVRAALSFTIRPESGDEVAGILADYPRPQVVVDETTRLVRTSVFLSGDRVVRVVDVEGDLPTALRHLAAQPQIRAVEEALNPHLTEARDLDDPQAARRFFARAMMPIVGPRTAPEAGDHGRCALLMPVPTGGGEQAAEALVSLSGALGPELGGTVFRREDVLVWLLEGLGSDPLTAARPAVRARQDELTKVLAWDGPDGEAVPLTRYRMRLVTDRVAEVAG